MPDLTGANGSGTQPDQPAEQQGQAQPTTAANNGEQRGSIDTLPTWAQEMIRELRDEAAQRRLALKSQEEESRKRDQARLAEEGKWKELAETRFSELSKLQPYQERAETLEGIIRKSNETRIARIREELRGLVPTEYAPEKLSSWLDTNWERLTTKPAPDLDAGAGGSGGTTPVRLTEEERQMAARFGMTPEQYAITKARL